MHRAAWCYLIVFLISRHIMGLTINCVKFLFFCLQNKVSFSETIMLGRQELFATHEDILRLAKKKGLNNEASKLTFKGKYSEELFKLLGAQQIDSMDFSNYENASVIHDLNKPLPDSLKNKYSVVIDGGTLEHVFNFPEALKSCMGMLKPGGHFIAITPANNQCGHGFYQFSPELFFSSFSEETGFRVLLLFLGADVQGKGIREWYAVRDPREVKARVTLSNSSPTQMMVLAQKLEHKSLTELSPYQSDYATIWQEHHKPKIQSGLIVKIYRFIVPVVIRDVVYRLRHNDGANKDVTSLGNVNPKYFTKVDF
jgi:SAM-dependent methyltransferase